jgi:hypothetical protein
MRCVGFGIYRTYIVCIAASLFFLCKPNMQRIQQNGKTYTFRHTHHTSSNFAKAKALRKT